MVIFSVLDEKKISNVMREGEENTLKTNLDTLLEKLMRLKKLMRAIK